VEGKRIPSPEGCQRRKDVVGCHHKKESKKGSEAGRKTAKRRDSKTTNTAGHFQRRHKVWREVGRETTKRGKSHGHNNRVEREDQNSEKKAGGETAFA